MVHENEPLTGYECGDRVRTLIFHYLTVGFRQEAELLCVSSLEWEQVGKHPYEAVAQNKTGRIIHAKFKMVPGTKVRVM